MKCMPRRQFLRTIGLTGTAIVLSRSPPRFYGPAARAQSDGRGPAEISQRESIYGRWVVENNLPAFVYDIDQDAVSAAEWDPIIPPFIRSRRNWLMVGNQAVRLQGANDGTVALFDETYGLRWLTAPDPSGTGVSIIHDAGKTWGTDFKLRSGESVPLRTFGPTWFKVQDGFAGLSLTRTILCPEGEVPWLLVHVRLAFSKDATGIRAMRHTERWALRPRFLNLVNPIESLIAAELRRKQAERAVSYTVNQSPSGLVATEHFASVNEPGDVGESAKHLIGPPAVLVLECLGDTTGNASYRFDGSPHPTLEIETPLTLKPGEIRDLWFRFGRLDNSTVARPDDLLGASLAALSKRLPTAGAAGPELAREIPWHAALLTGGAAVDHVIGGHSLDQGSAYSYHMGFNGAVRDPLQHALPLVYIQPDLALSVLQNTCAWARPTGELPYALDGAKQPTSLDRLFPGGFQPSDSNLWALWLAAEYAAATGDLAAFDTYLAYHPVYRTEPAPLREHLKRQFQYFVNSVGRGERDHVRILNADGNDLVIADTGVNPDVMKTKGGSVLNSAMASWVLKVFAGLATQLGETALAAAALAQAEQLLQLVRQSWNGRWFHRAYAPEGVVVGEHEMWLEVQPWAILCGAANINQAQSLVDMIANGPADNSPLGTRWRWPLTSDHGHNGIWHYVNMTLIWAAARVSPSWAWDQWRRMTLANHTNHYPEIWEGTLSGPDSWNHPESPRPGRTWAHPPEFPIVAMQTFPVNNMHSHAQPLLGYLRLLGVEPMGRGTLAVGKGGDFQSAVFQIDRTGHGNLVARGSVTLVTSNGTVIGGPGKISW
jgi:hypothetical protein